MATKNVNAEAVQAEETEKKEAVKSPLRLRCRRD